MMKFGQYCKMFKGNQNGYTLISMAISLIIIGLFVAAGVQLYANYKVEKETSTTEQRVQKAVSQIEEFRKLYGRYPCPSSLTAPRNNAAYGTESEDDCINTTAPIATGTCVNGVCVVNSDATRIALSPTVRIGAIPFRALQMDEKEAYDSYGSRLLYAVTQRQAVEATFRETEGGINIVDENGNNVVAPQGSANFVIVSPGPNKVGGFTVDGVQGIPCPAAGTSLETNNCVIPASPPANAEFASSFTSLAGGATTFDDTIDYFSTVMEPTWKRTTTNPSNIEAMITNNLGAGVTTTPAQTLDIGENPAYVRGKDGVGDVWQGSLRVSRDATNSSLQANRLCQSDGTQCFDVEDLTGATGIGCTNPGEYMVGIRGTGTNAEAICAPVKVQCPSGQALVKIETAGPNIGKPVCSAVHVNCPAGNVQLCDTAGNFNRKNSNEVMSNATAIGAGNHNDTKTVTDVSVFSYPGDPKKANFKCDEGVWKYNWWNGGKCGSECAIPAWVGPAPTYTGTNTTYGTQACNGALGSISTATTTVSSFNPASCTISNATTRDTPCNCTYYFPLDVSGNPTQGPDLSINPPVKPADVIGACGAGYNSGQKTTPYIWDSSDSVCNWKAGATTNSCTCDATLAGAAPATDPGKACNTIAGFEGTTGIAPAIWTFDSATGPSHCKWKVTGYDTSVCGCDTTTEHPSTSVHAPTCNTTCDKEMPAAVWVFKYEVDGGGNCVKGADYIKTPATCVAKAFTWTMSTHLSDSVTQPAGIDECGTSCRTSAATGPFAPPTPVGDGTACPELNTNGSCWTAEGVYKTYKAKCQAN